MEESSNSSDIRFAAVWPVKAKLKSDYKVVAIDCIKNFAPKDANDFNRSNLYKFRETRSSNYSLGHILCIGASAEDMFKGRRIRYPVRKSDESNLVPSSSEDETILTKRQRNFACHVKKRDATSDNTRKILDQYRHASQSSLDASSINLQSSGKKCTSNASSPKGRPEKTTEMGPPPPPPATSALDKSATSSRASCPDSHLRQGHRRGTLNAANKSIRLQSPTPSQHDHHPAVKALFTETSGSSDQLHSINGKKGTSATRPLQQDDCLQVKASATVAPESFDKLVSFQSKKTTFATPPVQHGDCPAVKASFIATPESSKQLQSEIIKKDSSALFQDIQSAVNEMKMIQSNINENKKEMKEYLESMRRERELAGKERKQAEEEYLKVRLERESLERVLEKFGEEKSKFDKDKTSILNQLNKKLSDLDGGSSTASSGSNGSKRSSSSSGPFADPSTSSSGIQSTTIHIGKKITADKDFWGMAFSSKSKGDWAHYALVAVFGENAKYYRAAKPRMTDENLRLFPEVPPVVPVLQYHYRKFLVDNPFLIVLPKKRPKKKDAVSLHMESDEDLEQGRDKDTDDVHDSDTDEANKEKKAQKQMMAVLKTLVEGLAALLADKATELYRKGKPRKSKAKSKAMDDRALFEQELTSELEVNPGNETDSDKGVQTPPRSLRQDSASPRSSRSNEERTPSKEDSDSDTELTPSSKRFYSNSRRKFSSWNTGPQNFTSLESQFIPMAVSTQNDEGDSSSDVTNDGINVNETEDEDDNFSEDDWIL